MKEQKKTISYMMLAFLFLCLVSLYRQIGIAYYPNDFIRPLFVFAGYEILLFTWGYSVKRRVTQRNLRYYIYTEILVMMLWAFLRFLQESLLYRDVYVMRVSGYFFAVPMMLIPLFGFYGVLGMDKSPEYKISKKWYFLCIPATALILLMLTNEYHHFVFKTLPNEVVPNLYFHPNWGIILITGLSLSIEFIRIIIIFIKSKNNNGFFVYKTLPFIWMSLIAISIIPYFLKSFVVEHELIEFTALQFFFEAMLWEICIALGMVPVNRQYEKVFECSSIAMQILDKNNDVVISSRFASKITNEQLKKLKFQRHTPLNENIELNLHKISNGYFIWQKDISHINSVLQELKKTAEDLEAESTILEAEIKAKSEEARINAKNEIYDDLLKDVGEQLEKLTYLIKNQDDTNDKNIWYKICFIGTYIKRYCNLGLTFQESGTIHCEDLEFSLYDMLKNLNNMDIKSELNFLYSGILPADFILFIVESFECIMEAADFNIDEIGIMIDGNVSFFVKSSNDLSNVSEAVKSINKNNYSILMDKSSDNCELSIEVVRF